MPRKPFTELSYSRQHGRVTELRGRPTYCGVCKRQDGIKYTWANVSGSYLDEYDFIPACYSCHNKMDGQSEESRKRRGQAVWAARRANGTTRAPRRPMSDDTKAKIAAKRRAWWAAGNTNTLTDEGRERRRVAMRNRVFTDEHRRKLRDAALKREARYRAGN